MGPLSGLVAAVSFEGDVLTWIHRFKYPAPGLAGLDPAARSVALELARAAAARACTPPPDCVVPIPLHRQRLAARGFNPSALLAREIARVAGVRFAPRLLVRTRDTPSQTGRGRRARIQNVAGAFSCRTPARVPDRIWLVDDVVTTGSTLREAARLLRRCGARQVLGICAARTRLLR